MTKRRIDREYGKLDYEIFVNRPEVAPYPQDVVKRRELLLKAQVLLAKILGAKQKRDKIEESWHECMYWLTMDNYYNWDKRAHLYHAKR